MIFLDTNVLLYAGSAAPADAAKKRRAQALIAAEDFGVSTQVIQEYIANALGKKSLGLSERNVDELLAALDPARVQPVTLELLREAWSLRREFQLSPWDASIVAAARALGCAVLYTEDLNPGQDYGGVVARNPFTGD